MIQLTEETCSTSSSKHLPVSKNVKTSSTTGTTGATADDKLPMEKISKNDDIQGQDYWIKVLLNSVRKDATTLNGGVNEQTNSVAMDDLKRLRN